MGKKNDEDRQNDQHKGFNWKNYVQSKKNSEEEEKVPFNPQDEAFNPQDEPQTQDKRPERGERRERPERAERRPKYEFLDQDKIYQFTPGQQVIANIKVHCNFNNFRQRNIEISCVGEEKVPVRI